MLTRNRGKSKSVVETLGLVKRRNGKRVKKGTDITKSRDLKWNKFSDAVFLPSIKSSQCISTNSSNLSRRISNTIHLEMREVDGYETDRTYPAIELNPSVLLNDWIPSKGTLPFKLCDSVLQEMCNEMSTTGCIFPSRKLFSKARKIKKEKGKQKTKMCFKDVNLQSFFTVIASDIGYINAETDKKEAFLASVGLVRSGIPSVLRRRRVHRHHEVKRRAVTRLRPNPRPRRFSDMVNVNADGVSNVKLKRRVRDRNVKAAAKKLAQAKSQASHALQSLSADVATAKRGRPRKTTGATKDSSGRWGAALKEVSKPTRPRRAIDVGHQIEWKFCYGADVKKTKSQKDSDTSTSRKRRETASVDRPPAKDLDTEQESVDNENEEEMRVGDDKANTVADVLDSGLRKRVSLKRIGSVQLGRKRKRFEIENDDDAMASGSEASSYHETGRSAVGHFKHGDFAASNRPRVSFATREVALSKMPHGGEDSLDRARSSHHGRRDANRKLTLLDRVVLGLACCVVQRGEDIQVKQLNDPDLNMLFQRVQGTDLIIDSMSTTKSSSGEILFNVMLTYKAPGTDVGAKPVRKHGQYRDAEATSPLLVGSGVDFSEGPSASDQDVGLTRKRSAFRLDRDYVTKERRQKPRHDLHVLQRMGLQHMSAPAAAAAAAANARRAKMGGRERESSDFVSDQGEEEVASVSSEAPRSSIFPIPAFKTPLAGFKRHSPRKIVRKMYTGTSTVPKILNRKRLLIAGGSLSSSHLPTTPSITPTATAPISVPQKLAVSQSAIPRPKVIITTSNGEFDSTVQKIDPAKPFVAVSSADMKLSKAGPEGLKEGVKTGVSETGTEVVVTTTTVESSKPNEATAAVSSSVRSESTTEVEGIHKIPAVSLSASQLLRMKRNQDENQQQPQTPQSASVAVVATVGTTAVQPTPSNSIYVVSTPAPLTAPTVVHTTQSVHNNHNLGSSLRQGMEVANVFQEVPAAAMATTATIFQLPAQLAAQVGATHPHPQTISVAAKMNTPLRGISSAPVHALPTAPATVVSSALGRAHLLPAAPTTTLLPFCKPSTVSTIGLNSTAQRAYPQIIATADNALTQTGRPQSSSSSVVVTGSGGNAILTARPVVQQRQQLQQQLAPNKRSVVHKLHSFRRPPKKPSAPSGFPASPAVPGNAAASSNSSSQLLKSLLESKTNPPPPSTAISASSHLVPSAVVPSPHLGLASPVTRISTVLPASAPLQSSQPVPHQSRGTWQVGGKAIVIGASINSPATSIRQRSLQNTLHLPQPSNSAAGGAGAQEMVIAPDSVPQPFVHETI